ncbi:hypothetical protein [Catalinimonas alkaloidigena]|nr:hypothetical protein [Catalinimonas alkaloidigena]
MNNYNSKRTIWKCAWILWGLWFCLNCEAQTPEVAPIRRIGDRVEMPLSFYRPMRLHVLLTDSLLAVRTHDLAVSEQRIAFADSLAALAQAETALRSQELAAVRLVNRSLALEVNALQVRLQEADDTNRTLLHKLVSRPRWWHVVVVGLAGYGTGRAIRIL